MGVELVFFCNSRMCYFQYMLDLPSKHQQQQQPRLDPLSLVVYVYICWQNKIQFGKIDGKESLLIYAAIAGYYTKNMREK